MLHFLRQIRQLQKFMPVLGDMALSTGQVVPQQQIEHHALCAAASSGMTLMSRRVAGFMVVIHIMSGSFSPRPLERWMVTFFPRQLAGTMSFFSLSE